MEDSFYFKGGSVVTRGEWKMCAPVEFNLTLDECANPDFVDQVSNYLAELFTQQYVDRHDTAYRDAMIQDDVFEA